MSKGLKILAVLLLGGVVLAACSKSAAAPTVTPTATPIATVAAPAATAISTPASTPTLAPTTQPTSAPAAIPTSAPTATPVAGPTPTATTGNAQDLYLANCQACHGPNRQGVPNLGTALTPARLSSLNDADIVKTITEGKPGTLMPVWKDILSNADIDSLVQFLKYTEP